MGLTGGLPSRRKRLSSHRLPAFSPFACPPAGNACLVVVCLRYSESTRLQGRRFPPSGSGASRLTS